MRRYFCLFCEVSISVDDGAPYSWGRDGGYASSVVTAGKELRRLGWVPLHVGWACSREHAERARSRNLEAEVTFIIRKVGIPANLLGYNYLRAAITLVVNRPDYLRRVVTKELYPAVAERCGTSGSRVERAIRYAIEVAWNRDNIEVINQLFGYTVSHDRGKPTNSQLIATIANNLRLKLGIVI